VLRTRSVIVGATAVVSLTMLTACGNAEPAANGAPPAASGSPQLAAALLALPPRMRAAVVFRFLHELDVEQTAQALGCSVGTVKSQTARALDKLRAALAQPPSHTTPITTTAGRSAAVQDFRERGVS
jgi:DNA-directed RNA polymerase specialized sigma24 family protein